MKKKLALFLVFLFLPLSALCESFKPPFIPGSLVPVSSEGWISHENLVYHYAFQLPSNFTLIPGVRRALFSVDADGLYDVQGFVGPGLEFQIQLKEPTYKNFQEEVEAYSDYLNYLRKIRAPEQPAYQNLRFAYEGTNICDFPAGKMLENAVEYEIDKDGDTVTVCEAYLDFYGPNRIEYIFHLRAVNTPFDQVRQLLYRVGRSIAIQPILLMNTVRE